MATYLPVLWRADARMFLKPSATRDFAARVGHPPARTHAPALSIEVHAALLDLAARAGRELADPAPRDRIDVQGFIWVVGDYREGRETVYP